MLISRESLKVTERKPKCYETSVGNQFFSYAGCSTLQIEWCFCFRKNRRCVSALLVRTYEGYVSWVLILVQWSANIIETNWTVIDVRTSPHTGRYRRSIILLHFQWHYSMNVQSNITVWMHAWITKKYEDRKSNSTALTGYFKFECENPNY